MFVYTSIRKSCLRPRIYEFNLKILTFFSFLSFELLIFVILLLMTTEKYLNFFCVLNYEWDYFVTLWCALRSHKQGESYSKSDPLHKPMHQEHLFPVVLQVREAGKGEAWQSPHPQQIPGSASALRSCSQDPVTGWPFCVHLAWREENHCLQKVLGCRTLKGK